MSCADFIDAMRAAAIDAQKAEIAFRKNISAEIARHERARQFAFRRVDIAERMLEAIGDARDEEEAVAAQIAALRSELGWYGETDERRKIWDHWSAVAAVIWRSVQLPADGAADVDEAEATVPGAMQAFETWYEAEFGTSFLAVFDQPVEEFPLVEF